jgi:hypothetical protein
MVTHVLRVVIPMTMCCWTGSKWRRSMLHHTVQLVPSRYCIYCAGDRSGSDHTEDYPKADEHGIESGLSTGPTHTFYEQCAGTRQ